MEIPINTIKTLNLVPCIISKDVSDTEFPIGSFVALNHESCPFDDVEGPGEVVPMPEGIVHGPTAVAVAWAVHGGDMVSAPYDPAFLIPLIPGSTAHKEKIREAHITEVLRRTDAAHEWQVRKMTEWLAKPIGNKCTPDGPLHRVICATQIIREQEPSYSINKLADEAGIPRTTLKAKLRGDSTLTTTDIFKIARAMDVTATDIMALSEKGDVDAPPAPGTIPPGFTKSDGTSWYEGKSMNSDRWTIRSEWDPSSGELWMAFWTHDDDPMTAAETREYAHALLQMSVYITTMSNIMATDVEADK